MRRPRIPQPPLNQKGDLIWIACIAAIVTLICTGHGEVVCWIIVFLLIFAA